LHLDQAIAQDQVIAFLRHLLWHLSGRIVVVWDRLGAHRGRKLRQWLGRCRRLRLAYLPAYAPELNPVEYAWGHTKTNPLANYAADTAEELHAAVLLASGDLAAQQALLRSFVHATGLPIRL